MIYRVFIKSVCLIFIFMFFYIGSCIDFSIPHASIIPSGSLCFTTVPGSSDPSQDEWSMFHGQLNHTGEACITFTGRASPFWIYAARSLVGSSPAVVGGRIYVGSANGKLYCLNAITGGFLWAYPTGGPLESSPAVTGGRVYIGSDDYKIYCLPTISTLPTYISVTESADPLELGSTENITISGVAALPGIKLVLLEFEGSNHTMTNLSGGIWHYSSWTPSRVGNYSYTIYIQDNMGNWNVTNGVIQVVSTTVIPAFMMPSIMLVLITVIGFFILKKRTEF